MQTVDLFPSAQSRPKGFYSTMNTGKISTYVTKITDDHVNLCYNRDILRKNLSHSIGNSRTSKGVTAMINKFEANNFDQEVMNSSQPVMVDFWAPWCTYCRALEPALEEFAQDTPDLKIGKVNVDEEPELARQFNIRTIPTVLLIQNGKILEKKVAPAEVEDLEEMVDSL